MRTPPDLERVRKLVLAHGWNATTYQLLSPGMRHWFWPGGEAVVGYVAHRGVWVVAGAPVCSVAHLPQVVRAFELVAARHGKRVCYFGAAGRLKTNLDGDPAYSAVVLGAQPVWHPADWATLIEGHRSLRGQLNRARNKGIGVTEWPVARAHNHPALWRILREWLSTRGLPPLHFLVEPKTLAHLLDRRVFVAQRKDGPSSDPVPVAFLVLAPIPQRNGWLTEQFVRGHEAPNGSIELLMDTAIRTLATEGAEYVTMGLVPLSQLGLAQDQSPFWLRLLLRWVRAHGRRFYNFDGLQTFKAKFHPQEWEPIWSVSRERNFSPGTLWAIAGAFSRQPPARLLLRGLLRAARQEWRWVRDR